VDDDPDYKKAASFYSASVRQDSSYACSWSGLGYSTWRESKGHDAEGLALAERYLQTAASLYSGHPGPWVHLGDILARRGDTEEAREYYLEALALNAKSEEALKGLWNLERFAGNIDQAKVYLKQALDARPEYYGTIYEFGVFSYYQGNMEQAEDFFTRLVELAPQQQQGYNLLGATFFEMDKYPDSKMMFENSLAIEPSYMAYSNLGTLYFYSGRLLDAAEMARKALALDDERYDAWRTLAESNYWTPGLRDSSQVAFQKCALIIKDQLAKSQVDGSSGYPELRSDLATVQVRLGKFEEAQVLLDGLEKEPHLEAPAMFNLASAFEQMDNRDKALFWLEKAVAADLSFAQVERYPGLRNLRTHPRYLALRGEYEGR
jgi:eukaryotic-like serine/threonine-protein kinase